MSDASLTLYVRGPADRVVEHDHDHETKNDDDQEFAVTERETVTLETEIAVDAEWLDRRGSVHSAGALIQTSDVAELVVDRLSSDDVDYYAGYERHDDWELMLRGRVDEWLDVAVAAADAYHSMGRSHADIATHACQVLNSLAELGTERPRLAMLDLVTQHDVNGFTRAEILDHLDERHETDASVQEETADA